MSYSVKNKILQQKAFKFTLTCGPSLCCLEKYRTEHERAERTYDYDEPGLINLHNLCIL